MAPHYTLDYIRSIQGKKLRSVDIGAKGNPTMTNVYFYLKSTDDNPWIQVREPLFGVRAECKLHHIGNIVLHDDGRPEV